MMCGKKDKFVNGVREKLCCDAIPFEAAVIAIIPAS